MRFLVVLATIAATVPLVFAASALAGRQIPIYSTLVFCDGELVAPTERVFTVGSSCVVNLQVEWLPGMNSAKLEVSSDGGVTWEKYTVSEFPATARRLVSGVGFSPCDFDGGTYLFRVRGWASRGEQGPGFTTEVFPESFVITCG